MNRLIIASDPSLVDTHERAFVERIARPRGPLQTYSSVLTDADCRQIDAVAYAEGRGWYRNEAGTDQTIVDGVSLGRSFEHVSTTLLVRVHRSRLILERLAAETGAHSVELRGVSREWLVAAAAAGLDVKGAPNQLGDIPGTLPDDPPAYLRASARLLSFGTNTGEVAFVAARAWAPPYARALTARWKLSAVDPGPRFVAAMMRGGRRMRVRWLRDAPQVRYEPTWTPPDALNRFVHGTFRSQAASMLASAKAGQEAVEHIRVAVACQDGLPPARAFILGMRSRGARALTLEHGISGAFADQVHPVADVLGVWGEPQREYHAALAPQDVAVRTIGWARLESAPSTRRSRRTHQAWDAVFFAQPSQDLAAGSWPEDQLRALVTVEAYAAAHPRRRIGVKLHPSAYAYGWKEVKLQHCQLVSGDSLDVLASTRVALVSLSTTGIEAMALGVPVVKLEDLGRLGGPDFIAAAGSPAVSEAGGLADAAERLLNDRPAYAAAVIDGQQYARRFIQGLDDPGAAPAAVISVVEELMRSH